MAVRSPGHRRRNMAEVDMKTGGQVETGLLRLLSAVRLQPDLVARSYRICRTGAGSLPCRAGRQTGFHPMQRPRPAQGRRPVARRWSCVPLSPLLPQTVAGQAPVRLAIMRGNKSHPCLVAKLLQARAFLMGKAPPSPPGVRRSLPVGMVRPVPPRPSRTPSLCTKKRGCHTWHPLTRFRNPTP